jgi:hypothetical protein
LRRARSTFFPAAAHHRATAQHSTRPSRPNTCRRTPSLSPATRWHRQVGPTSHPRPRAVAEPDSSSSPTARLHPPCARLPGRGPHAKTVP